VNDFKIIYKLASRSRKEKCFSCIENIIAQSTIEDYLILLSFDVDDVSMQGDEVKERLSLYGGKVKAYWGVSGSKVTAINRDIGFVGGWRIICNHSDDFWITSRGFDTAVVKAMERYFPDTDGMIHFPDQVAKERLCTYQIVGRKYYDRTGYIYCPEYKSLYCDNEEFLKAKLLGKYEYIPLRYLEHRHPIWGYGQADDLLRHTESFYDQDRNTFLRRQAINFGI
jgi:hypothetical protein